MDPFSIVVGSLALAELAFKVGSSIFHFVKSAAHVDKTIEELGDEVNSLGAICRAIGQITEIDGPLGVSISPQLRRCTEVLARLDRAVPRTTSSYTDLVRAGMQFRLDLSQEDISECRRQITSCTSNLQLSLGLLNLKATFLAPKLANDMLLQKLEELTKTIDTQGQRLDERLVSTAGRYISDGQVLYARSNASVSGISSSLKHKAISDWVSALDTLRLDSVSELSSQDDLDDLRSVNHGPATVSSGTTVVPDVEAGAISSSDNEDFEHQLTKDMTDSAIAAGARAFEMEKYGQAESMLREGLKQLQLLPEHLRRTYVLDEIHYQLAVCTYHLHDSESAEEALSGIVARQTGSKKDAVQKLEAGSLLAQVYVRLNKLDLAMSDARNVYMGRRKVLGKDSDSCLDAVALLARIAELSDNLSLATIYRDLLPQERLEEFRHRYDSLSVMAKPGIDKVRQDSVSTHRSDNTTYLVGERPPLPERPSSQVLRRPISSDSSPLFETLQVSDRRAICAYSRNGALVAGWSSDDDKEHFLGVIHQDGARTQPIRIASAPKALAISDSGLHCAWTAENNRVHIQPLDADQEIQRLNMGLGFMPHPEIAFAPGDRVMALAFQWGVTVIDWRTDESLYTYSCDIGETLNMTTVDKLCSLSDNDYLGLVSDNNFGGRRVHIVDWRAKRERAMIKLGRKSHVRQLFWNTAGSRLAVVTTSKTADHIRIFDREGNLATQTELPVLLDQHSEQVGNKQKERRTDVAWFFLDQDVVGIVLKAPDQLAMYDSAHSKWWYVSMRQTRLALEQPRWQSLSRDRRLLLRTEDDHLVLFDVRKAIQHSCKTRKITSCTSKLPFAHTKPTHYVLPTRGPPKRPLLLLLLELFEPLPPAADDPLHSISLQLVLLLELELSPAAAPELPEVPPALVLEVLETSPLLPQPLLDAAPSSVLFSASASHSVSPAVPVAVDVGAVVDVVLVELVVVPLAWRGYTFGMTNDIGSWTTGAARAVMAQRPVRTRRLSEKRMTKEGDLDKLDLRMVGSSLDLLCPSHDWA